MSKISLDELVNKLKSSPRIKGIFFAGTTGADLKPYSDYDIVIILDKNTEEIKSLYTNIDDRFSDIFFFDINYLEDLEKNQTYPSTSFQAMLLNWLNSGKIEYDPTGLLESLKNKSSALLTNLEIPQNEKRNNWMQVNYNFIANNRYYNSNNELYHKALHLRLLYSVIGLTTAYFLFRNMTWRGEKTAIKYFEEKDLDYINTFNKYNESTKLEDKMKFYNELFKKTVNAEYPQWDKDFVIPSSNSKSFDVYLIKFWNDILI